MIYINGILVTFNIIKKYLIRIKNYKEWIMLISLSLLSFIGISLFSLFLTIKSLKEHYNNK